MAPCRNLREMGGPGCSKRGSEWPELQLEIFALVMQGLAGHGFGFYSNSAESQWGV